MPKINALDSKTLAVTGELKHSGRTVKASTQQTPTAAPVVPSQKSQPDAIEGQAPEAKPLPPEHEGLARKEIAIRNRERELQAKEAAIEDRVKKAVEDALGQYRGKLKNAPLEVLNEEGLTYDQLVEQAVAMADPNRAIHQKIEALEKSQAKQIEESKKAADQQRQAAINQIRFDVKDMVDADPQFETIKGTGSHDDVVDLITRTFDETGKLMTVEQAAKLVEDELFQEAVKIASLGKVKAKLQPDLASAVEQSKARPPAQQQQIETLTNSMASGRKLTPKERAIMRANGFKGEF